MLNQRIDELSQEDLDFFLGRFVAEVRKEDGQEHPGKTIYEMICNLQCYLHFQRKGPLFLIDKKGCKFRNLNSALNFVLKERAGEGIGSITSQAEVITPDQKTDRLHPCPTLVMRLFSKSLAIGLPASRVGVRKDGSCPSVSDRLDPPTFPTLCKDITLVMRLFSMSLAIGLPASRVGVRKDESCPSVSDRLDPPTFPTLSKGGLSNTP